LHNIISISVFNHFNFDKRIRLGLLSVISLTRPFSSIRSKNNPESLTLEHMNSKKPTTFLILNEILLNQNLSITESKLVNLLKVKGVEFDLPISTPDNIKLLGELTGKSSYKGFSGVYIFIHKNTGQKYVGSSNLLRRRMNYYFKGDFPLVGKFLPLLHKKGLNAFKLIIFKLDSNIFCHKDALFLEQYHLLNKEFNLNTLRVINAGSSKGDPIYVYDLTYSTLYYHAKSNIDLKRVLKIHTETSKKYVDSNIPYLKKYFLLSYPILTALTSNMSVNQLVDIMQKERQNMYTLGTRRSIPVELEIKEGNTFVNLDSIGQTLKFDSLGSCIDYLGKLGLTIKRATLTNYIKKKKVFHNFFCQYSYNNLPNNFEEVGLIIDEYKKLKVVRDSDSLYVNRKNKPILVKGHRENFEKEFESIKDTIKYFDSLNIKLDRKTLYLRLKDGKIYKGYYFSPKI
jgi:hypothetical protein